MEDFYMFITSLDSKDNYPSNSYCKMSVDLQEAMELQENDDCYWTVGLVDIAISNQTTLTQSNVILLCDLVDSSYIRNMYRPIMRIFSGDAAAKGSLFMPYYHKVNRLTFRTINLEFVDINLKPIIPLVKEAVLACTLHFQYNRRV
jgi:hypothetical protein